MSTTTTAESVRRVAPSAFGDDARRFLHLTLMLARTDFKLRYFGSALGYVWSLVRPLLFFGVLYVVFTQVFKAGRGVPHYPLYLLTAIVMWTFFLETTSGSVQCLLYREGLLRKMRFPRLVIPLSVAVTALFNLGMNFIVVVIFAAATGVDPRLSWLEMPVLIALLALLAVGIGMLLSVLYVRFRDIQPIWDVTAQILFYASPIIYTAKTYPASVVRIAMLNPIAMIMTQMHKAFIDPSAHSAARVAGGAPRLLIPLAIIAAAVVLGTRVFTREAPRIAENL
jgi:ABC-2 type transport system permease protein